MDSSRKPTQTPSGYDPEEALCRLTPEQRDRLSRLSTEMRIDRVTVSFSIEGRGLNGKKAAFYSATGSRAADPDGNPQVYTEADAKVAACLLSKHVIGITYGDAARRQIIPAQQAREELVAILRSYDDRLVALLGRSTPETKQSPE